MTTEDLPPEIGALLASLTELTPVERPRRSCCHAALAARPADAAAAAADRRRTVPPSPAPSTTCSTPCRCLTEDDWQRRAVNGLTVGELVGHLIGTQLSMAAEFGLAAPVTLRVTRLTTPRRPHRIDATRHRRRQSDATPAEAADEFADESASCSPRISAGLDAAAVLEAESRFGSIVADVRFLLIVRVFELWTHDNDLRRAVGLGRVEPDPDRLWMMTRAVMPIVDWHRRRPAADRA